MSGLRVSPGLTLQRLTIGEPPTPRGRVRGTGVWAWQSAP